MNAVVVIESLFLVAAAWFLWRRSRVEKPREGLAFLLFVVALALHVAAGMWADPFIGWASHGRVAAAKLNSASLALLAVQVVRCLLLAVALYCWLVVVRPRLVRSWRGVLILLCLLLITLFPAGSVGFGILMVLPVLRLKWTRNVHGWGRLGLIVAFGVLMIALAVSVTNTVTGEGLGEIDMQFGEGGAITEVRGELPTLAANVLRLNHPWERALKTLLVLLHLQTALAFLQLLVVPVRLRGLSLKRRFTVTLAMYRFIPGTLALIFMVLIAYLGIGLHRARIVHHDMDVTLEQSLQTVENLIATGAARQRGPIAIPTPAAGDRSFAVVRDLEWVAETDTTVGAWSARTRAWSRGTPASLRDWNAFAHIPADTSIGLSEANSVLYLRAARISGRGERRIGVEVFVPVDSTYLARVVQTIQSDVRIDVSPRVFIGESSVQVVGDEESGWADTSFTVEARYPRVVTSGGLWERPTFLARNFLPTGNWLDAFGGSTRVGAVQLRLSTTPRGLWESLTGNALVLTSQMFAVIILVGIALLFLIVELSAVRTGRSIIKGIVTDVKNLTVAARKFGEGDLSHRVELSGRDEMGQLAATFNSMAANIEQHQEVLLEKERLEADLAVAREIQQRMLPQSPPVIPGLDVAGLSLPSREVGGDLFYFLPVSNGRLGLTIGDVSGKSVPAALLMSNVLAALRSEARIVDKEDEILVHLNRLIVEQVEPGRFVTFFYGVVDPSAHMLRYACAGHNPPLVMRADGAAEWLHEAGVPLGVMPESTYTPAEIALGPGDVLVLYSDGVTEAQRGDGTEAEGEGEEEPDEFFDEHRLEAAVREARTRSSSEIITHVMDSIRAFTEGAEQSDDVTLVVVRIVR